MIDHDCVNYGLRKTGDYFSLFDKPFLLGIALLLDEILDGCDILLHAIVVQVKY